MLMCDRLAQPLPRYVAPHPAAGRGTGAPRQCGNSSSWCPADAACCPSKYSPSTFGCAVPAGRVPAESAGCGDGIPSAAGPGSTATVCCKMGPALPPAPTKKNVLVIGDSVSIGYVGRVASRLEQHALVQHGPWDVSDGGASDTASIKSGIFFGSGGYFS